MDRTKRTQPHRLPNQIPPLATAPSADAGPQLSDVLDMYPGLRDAESVFGYDLDFDDPEDPQAGRETG
jgi:hypothetical protein